MFSIRRFISQERTDMKEVYVLITRYHPDITASGNLIKNLIPFFKKHYMTYILSEGVSREDDQKQNIYRFPTDNKVDFITKVRNRLGKKTLSFNSKMYNFLEEKIKQLTPSEKIGLIPITIEEMALPLSEQIKFYEREIITRKLRKYANKTNPKDLVAKELGMSRATLYRKLTELDIK